MNKNLAILSGVFFMILMLGIVYAAEDVAPTGSTYKSIYGQCVSENAIIKNSCFATAKETLATCKASVPQDTGKKAALKQCIQDYKIEKKQCKLNFKTSNKECKKTRNSNTSKP